MMNQRGVTIVDLMLILVIVVLSLVNFSSLDDVYDTYQRKNCYYNQTNLDKILWDTCFERQREIFDVALAYAIKYPDTRHPVMVVLFNPNRNAELPQKDVVVVDLTQQKWTNEQLCPLHTASSKQPIIDYWFAFGRWHCLYNRYHSE
ncbi:MAG: hypothetical protein P9L99_16625 [Candidatus Lernaella stagnicola]|nr:hypothetical protein [Candidatus Lernaella stagnicola]